MSETTDLFPRSMRPGSFPLSGLHFRPDDGGGNGGDQGGQGGDGGAGGSGGQDGGDGAGSNSSGDRTFTQADVDRIVQERLARVKTTPPADYEELKAAASKLAEIEASNKSELEKAQERAATLERERDEARTAAQETKLRSAIVAEAARKNAVDPDAVVALLDRSTLEFDDDGNPTNIADAMESLLTAKPYLAGGGNGRSGNGADQGARGAANQLRSTEGMSPEEIAKAVAEGRLDEYLKSPTK